MSSISSGGSDPFSNMDRQVSGDPTSTTSQDAGSTSSMEPPPSATDPDAAKFNANDPSQLKKHAPDIYKSMKTALVKHICQESYDNNKKIQQKMKGQDD